MAKLIADALRHDIEAMSGKEGCRLALVNAYNVLLDDQSPQDNIQHRLQHEWVSKTAMAWVEMAIGILDRRTRSSMDDPKNIYVIVENGDDSSGQFVAAHANKESAERELAEFRNLADRLGLAYKSFDIKSVCLEP